MAYYASYAKLVVLDNATKKDERSIPIRSNPITFGAHPMNTIQIRSEWAERLHCKIAVNARSHTATIVNFSKACPVLVNGEQQAAKSILENNHLFEVAGVLFRWCFDAAENYRNKIRVPCPSRILSRPLKRVKSSENFTDNSISRYPVPQSLNSFLSKIRSRRTLASITRKNLSELLTGVELDANSTTTPKEAIIPEYLITPVKEREDIPPLPTPDRPKRTPCKKQQLNCSGTLIVSYTPAINQKPQRHANCKTPLSTTKRTPLRLKNGVAVTPAPATPEKLVNMSKPDHSMYLIDLTTPTPKSGLACKTPKKPATPHVLSCINLVTPSPKNNKATPMQSKKAPLSATRGLLKSALANSSKGAITPARKPMHPQTPISRRGTPIAAKSTPITTKHRLLLREIESHSTPERVRGENDQDVEPAPLCSDDVQVAPLNADAETEVALDTIPLVLQPVAPFNVCAVIKKPNQTRQVRSAKYSDVTPHESFVEGQEAKSLEEAPQRDSIQVADVAQQMIAHDSSGIGTTRKFSEEELLASDTESFPVMAVPSENEDELLLLDSDTEPPSKQSITASPTTTTTAPVGALSSPRLRNSLRDTRKFISSAYTSLNTSRPQMDLTAEIDESLLLDEDTALDDEIEPANRTYDLTDLSDRPSAPEQENDKRLSKSFTISVDAARSPMLHRSPVQFISTRKVDKTLSAGRETLTSRNNNESASYVEGDTAAAARASYAAGESENCTESSLYVWNAGTVDGPPASEHMSVANEEQESVVVVVQPSVMMEQVHEEDAAGAEMNDPQESPEKLVVTVDDATEDCCGVPVRIPSGSKEVETIPDFRGMKQMLKTPKITQADVNLVGVKELLNTPPVNELTGRNLVGVKCLFRSSPAKQQRQGMDDLRGVRELLKTPKTTTKGEEAVPNLVGMKEMLRTPTTKGTTDPSSLAGVRDLWRTPKLGVAATRPGGMRKFCTSSPATPSLVGVRDLMKTPTRVEVDDDVAEAMELLRTPVRRTRLDGEVLEATQALPTPPPKESIPEDNNLRTDKPPQQLEIDAIIDEDAVEDINAKNDQSVLAGADVVPGEEDLSTNGCPTPSPHSRLDVRWSDEQEMESSFVHDDKLTAGSVCEESVVEQDSSLADTVAVCVIEEGKSQEQELPLALSGDCIPKDEPVASAVGNQAGGEESVPEHSTAAAIVDVEEVEANSVRSEDVADVPLNDFVECRNELVVEEKNEGQELPETMPKESETDERSTNAGEEDNLSTPSRMVEHVVAVVEEGLSSTCTVSPDLVVKGTDNLVPPEASSCESATDGQAIDEKVSSDHDDVSEACGGATIVLAEKDEDEEMPQSQSDESVSDCEVISSSPEELVEELTVEAAEEPPVQEIGKTSDANADDKSPVSSEQELPRRMDSEIPSGQFHPTERINLDDMSPESPQGSISIEKEMKHSEEQVLPNSPLDESMPDRQTATGTEEKLLEEPSVEAAMSVQDAEQEPSANGREVISRSPEELVEELTVEAAEEPPVQDAGKMSDTNADDVSPSSREQELSRRMDSEIPSGETVTERINLDDMSPKSPQGSISTEKEEHEHSEEQVLPKSPLDESIPDRQTASGTEEKLLEEPYVEAAMPVQDAEQEPSANGQSLTTAVCDIPVAQEKLLKPAAEKADEELDSPENLSGESKPERDSGDQLSPAPSICDASICEENLSIAGLDKKVVEGQESVKSLADATMPDPTLISSPSRAEEQIEVSIIEASVSLQDVEKETNANGDGLSASVCDTTVSQILENLLLEVEKTEAQELPEDSPLDESMPDRKAIGSSPSKELIEEESAVEVQEGDNETSSGNDSEISVTVCDVSGSESIETPLSLAVEKTEAQELPEDSPLDESMPDRKAIGSSPSKELIEEESAVEVQEGDNETSSGNDSEISVTVCDVSGSESIETPLSLAVEKKEQQELSENPSGEPVPESNGPEDDALPPVFPSSNVSIDEGMKDCEDSETQADRELISSSPSFAEKATMSVRDVEKETSSEAVGVVPVSEEKIISTETAEAFYCIDETAEEKEQSSSDEKSIAEQINEAAITIPDAEKVSCLKDDSESKPLATETEEAPPCVVSEKDADQDLSNSASVESKPDCETISDPSPPTTEDMPKDAASAAAASSMDAVAKDEVLGETDSKQGTVEKVDEGAKNEEEREFKTPKAAAPKRRLFSRRVHEEKTPEMKTPSPVAKLTDQDYLKILDDLNDKESKQSKSSTQQSPLERRVLPSRAARDKIQTLCVEDLAGEAPVEKFCKPKPLPEEMSPSDEKSPVVDVHRRVVFNSAIAVREFDSPNIVGDIIMNNKPKGRGGGRKKLVVEEATLVAVADAKSVSAVVVTADVNDTTSGGELVQGHEEPVAKRRGRPKRQQEPEAVPKKRTTRGTAAVHPLPPEQSVESSEKSTLESTIEEQVERTASKRPKKAAVPKTNKDSATDSNTPVKATIRRGRKAAAVEEAPVSNVSDAIPSTEATSDKSNQEEAPEESAGAKRPRKAAASKRKIKLPEQSVEESKGPTDQGQEGTQDGANNDTVNETPVKAPKRGRKATGKENAVSSATTDDELTKVTQPEEEPVQVKPRGRQRIAAVSKRKIAPVTDGSVEVTSTEKDTEQVQENVHLEPPSGTPVKTTKRGGRKVTRKENLPAADASDEVVPATAAATQASTIDQLDQIEEEQPAKSEAKRPRRAAATKRKIAPVADESVEVTLSQLKEGSVEEEEQEVVSVSSSKQPRKVAGKRNDFESVNASSTPAKPARGKRIAKKKGIVLDESIDPIMMEKETTLDRHADKSLQSESGAGGDGEVEHVTAAATAASIAPKAKETRGKKPAPLEASSVPSPVPARATRATRGRKQLEVSDANNTAELVENSTTDLPQPKRRGRPPARTRT